MFLKMVNKWLIIFKVKIKFQLWQSLQTYEKISMTMQKRSTTFLSLNEFVPQTFKLDEKNDRDIFFNTHKRLFNFL